MRLFDRERVSYLWLLYFLLFLFREVTLTGGCGGGGCGGSGSGEGGFGDLTGILIGFLLARAVSSGTTASSVFQGARVAIDQPPATGGGRIAASTNQKIVLSPETVHRIEEMRRENGFGFLWGAKSAQTMQKMVVAADRANTGPADTRGRSDTKKAVIPKAVSKDDIDQTPKPNKPAAADKSSNSTVIDKNPKVSIGLNATELAELEKALAQASLTVF